MKAKLNEKVHDILEKHEPKGLNPDITRELEKFGDS